MMMLLHLVEVVACPGDLSAECVRGEPCGEPKWPDSLLSSLPSSCSVPGGEIGDENLYRHPFLVAL